MIIDLTDIEYAAISQSLNIARKKFQEAIVTSKLTEEEASIALSFLNSANSARTKIRRAYDNKQSFEQGWKENHSDKTLNDVTPEEWDSLRGSN